MKTRENFPETKQFNRTQKSLTRAVMKRRKSVFEEAELTQHELIWSSHDDHSHNQVEDEWSSCHQKQEWNSSDQKQSISGQENNLNSVTPYSSYNQTIPTLNSGTDLYLNQSQNMHQNHNQPQNQQSQQNQHDQYDFALDSPARTDMALLLPWQQEIVKRRASTGQMIDYSFPESQRSDTVHSDQAQFPNLQPPALPEEIQAITFQPHHSNYYAPQGCSHGCSNTCDHHQPPLSHQERYESKPPIGYPQSSTFISQSFSGHPLIQSNSAPGSMGGDMSMDASRIYRRNSDSILSHNGDRSVNQAQEYYQSNLHPYPSDLHSLNYHSSFVPISRLSPFSYQHQTSFSEQQQQQHHQHMPYNHSYPVGRLPYSNHHTLPDQSFMMNTDRLQSSSPALKYCRISDLEAGRHSAALPDSGPIVGDSNAAALAAKLEADVIYFSQY